MIVSKRFRFEAAHHLNLVPENHKCRRPHGHSYEIEILVKGEMHPNGMVVDYAEISRIADPLIEELDHQDLNERFDFETTAENLALWFLGKCSDLGQVGVRVYETPTTMVEVWS